MNTNTTYHIDVTPEENQLFKEDSTNSEKNVNNKISTKATFVKVFCVVLGVHLIGAAAIGFTSMSAKAANLVEDKKYVGQDNEKDTQTTNSTVQPAQTPVTTMNPALPKIQPSDWPKTTQPPVVTRPVVKTETSSTSTQSQKHNDVKYTSEYTVKKGDTINSIAKKYKMSADRLMQLNNIKDPTKLQIGHTLKFM